MAMNVTVFRPIFGWPQKLEKLSGGLLLSLCFLAVLYAHPHVRRELFLTTFHFFTLYVLQISSST
jgi:hypothetical protein